MTADELETRLFYIGTVALRLSEAELWNMPHDRFADLWAIHRIYNGTAKPQVETFIDDIMD